MLNRGPHPVWLAHAARQRPSPFRRWQGLALAFAGAVAAAAGSLIVALFLLPSSLVFPLTGFALVLAGATFALLAWAAPPEVSNRLVFWDVAGIMTLLGLAAALLGEPEQAIALLERDG